MLLTNVLSNIFYNEFYYEPKNKPFRFVKHGKLDNSVNKHQFLFTVNWGSLSSVLSPADLNYFNSRQKDVGSWNWVLKIL